MSRRLAIASALSPEASRNAFSRLPMSSKRIANSVDLDPGLFHHALPFGEIGFDQRAELGRATGIDLAALPADRFLHLGLREDLRRLAMQLRHYVRRRARGRHEPGPERHFVARHARLGEGR